MHTYYLLHIISNGYVLFSIMDCIEFLERSNIESPPITCIPRAGFSLDWPFFKSELYPDIYFSPVLLISMFLKPIFFRSFPSVFF